LSLVAALAVAAPNPLGPYKVDPTKITVGGLSSGAFMAVQYHVAFSSSIAGAAMFAGGPYYCAQGQETNALTTCMTPVMGGPSASELAALTELFASSGSVDPVANLKNSKVYIYSGLVDTVVERPVVQALQQYYQIFSANVTTEYGVLSEHTFPTVNYGNSCPTLGEPYISNCNYDGAGKSLSVLYGQLQPRTTAVAANLMMFDQTKIAIGNSLNTLGFIYVPTACQNSSATCSLHVNLHGCQQTTADIQFQYPEHVGLNEWAESNNIIVVYPQVSKSYVLPSNPEGCWDWWGYTNSNYANKQGAQMVFLQSLIKAITGSSE